LPLRWDDPAQLLLFSREDDGQETSGKVLIQEAAY